MAESLWPAIPFRPDHFGGASHSGAILASHFMSARPFRRSPSWWSHSGKPFPFQPDHIGGAHHRRAILASHFIWARPFRRSSSPQSHSGQQFHFGATFLAETIMAEPFWPGILFHVGPTIMTEPIMAAPILQVISFRPEHYDGAHHGGASLASHSISARPFRRSSSPQSHTA